MAFDKELDKQIYEEEIEMGNNIIKVGVYSYNEGPKKMQLIRQSKTQEGELRFAKLGRLTKEEAEKVIPAMQKAFEKMD